MRSRIPVIFFMLLLALGAAGRTFARLPSERSVVGVVAAVDVVGKAIELRTTEATGRPHRVSFAIGDPTEIRLRARAGSIADLRVGDEVTVVYSARAPQKAVSIEVH